MQKTSTPHSPAFFGRTAAMTLIAAAVLTACGGGGGNPGAVPAASGVTGNTGVGSGSGGTGTTPAVPAAPTATVTLLAAAGQADATLSEGKPLTAQVAVKDGAGKPVEGAFVTFATNGGIAVFKPSSGSVRTNAQGVASVQMLAANLAADGAAKLLVTAEVGTSTITAQSVYTVGATPLTFSTPSATSNKIQAYETTTLSVELRASGVLYNPPVKVEFTSPCAAAGKASLTASVSSSKGLAQAVYRDLGCANSDVVTVSSDSVATAVSTTLDIAPPAAASVQFVAAAPTDKSIVIQGQGGINRTETATLKFRVIDTFGHPLPRRLVDFRVSVPTLVTLNKTSDSTDDNGEVVTTVNSGPVPTTFRVFATLPNTATATQPDISTTSDSIVVTSGLPVQRAFSLSAGKVNLESYRESSPTQPATYVQALISDGFGNPVPDGTPVVFQTNMGSVGSADKGGCITVNGGCQVDFRMQEPRVATPGLPATPCNTGSAPGVSPDSTRPGLATVCASTTDGANTIFNKLALFFSGSHAVNVFMNGAATPLSGTTDLGGAGAVESKVFVLQLNDVNLNPLPAGTKVAVTNMVNGAAEVTPAVVQNVFPHTANGDDFSGNNVVGAQGSYHTFTISNPAGKACTVPVTATFNVTITTPAEVVTTIPFKLAFSCP